MLRIIPALLLLFSVAAYLQDITPDFPTSTSAPDVVDTTSTMTLPDCGCRRCEEITSYMSTHTQTEFCRSHAVILGRIYQRTNHSVPAGIWMSENHTTPSVLPEHYEYSVRVIQVYSNPGPAKISLGDKITIRAQKLSACDECENKVENLDDSQLYPDRFLRPKEKYFFFIPTLMEGYGDKPEGFLEQCSRVWDYRKLEEPGLPPIIRLKRYLLHSTKCDKCVVSGCFQSRCAPAGEVESCLEREDMFFTSMWLNNACKPLMDYGICHYNAKQDRCLWTSVTDDGIKSRRPIRECFSEDY